MGSYLEPIPLQVARHRVAGIAFSCTVEKCGAGLGVTCDDVDLHGSLSHGSQNFSVQECRDIGSLFLGHSAKCRHAFIRATGLKKLA